MCLNDCSGHGECKGVGYAGGGTFCACFDGYSGLDCSAKECPPDCFAYGGVCNGKGVCEVSCSNKVGYACMNLTVARGETRARARCPLVLLPSDIRSWRGTLREG